MAYSFAADSPTIEATCFYVALCGTGLPGPSWPPPPAARPCSMSTPTPSTAPSPSPSRPFPSPPSSSRSTSPPHPQPIPSSLSSAGVCTRRSRHRGRFPSRPAASPSIWWVPWYSTAPTRPWTFFSALNEQQVAVVRVLQLISNVAICPPGMFVAHLSIPCVDASMGKLCINKAIKVLFSSQASNGSEGHLETTRKDNEDAKPVLIWNCIYVQDITQGTSRSILSCPMPDEYLDYKNILESTKKLFVDAYPNEEFLPRNSAAEYENDF